MHDRLRIDSHRKVLTMVQTDLENAASAFCDYIAEIGRSFPPSSRGGVETVYHWNSGYFTPIFFNLTASTTATDCPELDFVSDQDNAVSICNERLGSIINGCEFYDQPSIHVVSGQRLIARLQVIPLRTTSTTGNKVAASSATV